MKQGLKRIRRGATAVMAMMFLVLITTLSFAMFSMSSMNTQSAENLSDVQRARSAAESGLRWMGYRFIKMARPKTTIGSITPAVADSLWPSIVSSLQTDFASLLSTSERGLTVSGKNITSKDIRIATDNTRFSLSIAQHPLFAGDPLDARYIRVTSTGKYNQAVRSASMEFLIDKKIKYAVVGKVEIQLGRNTVVQGPIAMATPAKYPPVLTLSDFTHFDPNLKTKIQNYENFLEGTHTANGNVVPNHAGYDGRIKSGTEEFTYAQSKGYADTNGDNFIDEYDIFLKQYDSDGDKAISQSEFTNPATGKLYDANLFAAIDSAGGPMFDGDVVRAGLNDGKIDNSDAYAKVQGQMVLATSASGWASNLASQGKTINDMIGGPIADSDVTEVPVEFGAASNDIMDLSPANFDACVENFRNQVKINGANPPAISSVPAVGTTVTGKTIDGSKANNGSAVEHTPFGSTSYQATYQRPVYKNVTFVNCVIKKGTNALFDGCTFKGVTFVDMTHDITDSANHVGGSVVTDPTSGMNWSKKMKSGTFSNTTTLTSANSYGFADGNNIRFNNCTFNGPIAATDATAYTHFTNSWEFTGATMFDNQADETATIVCPNTNIEMGSFTDPNKSPSTLKGVVVAGNIDIRGTSVVDGSIIVTGDGAGNTTLGYFGADDGSTDPSAMPEGGYGRLNIRYNPHRALPDGINIAIDLTGDPDTYAEGLQ
jgi:hypothetical protein